MARRKKTLGKDAVVSVLLKYVHPSEHIRNKFVNPLPNQVLQNCTVLRQEVKKIHARNQLAIVIRHPEFMDGDSPIELYATKRWFKIQEEGPADFFFTQPAATANTEVPEEEEQEMPAAILEQAERGGTLEVEDYLGMGLTVDNDKEPAPENVPTNTDRSEVAYDGWAGHQAICPRRSTVGAKKRAKIIHFPRDVIPTSLQLFELLFPTEFVKTVMLPKMNERLEEQAITYGEWLRFIGLWFLMATTFAGNRRDFWSKPDPSMCAGAPWQLGEFMSRYHFDKILGALYFTDSEPPPFKDQFWEVRQMLDAWNVNMDENFSCSWVACLDESMSKWLSQYTCPGFMVVPRKPWPFGNEYHTIACGETEIIFRVDLVEGKDQPPEKPKEFSREHTKTVATVLRLAKPLFGTGTVIIMDSGFCVLKVIIALLSFGVYLSALIKKRRYWPKDVPGDDIGEHFNDRVAGDVDVLPGMMQGHRFFYSP